MIVELAIGDAYGAGFEYADIDIVKRYNNLQYRKHDRHNIMPGQYTDDTQMTLAIAELIISGNEWTKEELAKRFLNVFHRDQHKGYANGFYKFLLSTHDEKEFLKNIRPDSDKSGSAMRSCPIGIYSDINEVIEKSTIQSEITHNTVDGINASIAASLMTHYFIYDIGPKKQLGKFLASKVKGGWDKEWDLYVGSKGWMSVRAAITAVQRNSKMSELLKDCISFTGDVDTVATIALAAGSCSKEIIQDIPQHLYDGLEKGKYGINYLKELDEKIKNLKS